jgi:hypothetical protein
MQQSQYLGSGGLNKNSYSPTKGNLPSLLNGSLPSHRLSQTSANVPSLTSNNSPNKLHILTNCNNSLKQSEKMKDMILIICLTIILAFLFITTIELSTILVKYKNEEDILLFNLTIINNQTKLEKQINSPINSFFACVWIFNLLLFIICLFVHIFIYQQRSQRNRARAAFLR